MVIQYFPANQNPRNQRNVNLLGIFSLWNWAPVSGWTETKIMKCFRFGRNKMNKKLLIVIQFIVAGSHVRNLTSSNCHFAENVKQF